MDHRIPIIALLSLTTELLVVSRAYAVDPAAAQCIAASEKAMVLRDQHKLRAARAELALCTSPSCPAEVRKDCAQRVDELNAAIPSIVFGAKDAQGNDLSAVTVTMDGERLIDQLDGTAVVLDPGPHTFTFTSVGLPSTTKTIIIREGEKKRTEVVQLGARASALPETPPAVPPPPPGPSTPSGALESPPPPPPPPPPRPAPRHRLAYGFLGLGVAGAAVGAVTGGLMLSKKGTIDKHCTQLAGNASSCDQTGKDAGDAAKTLGLVSSIGWVSAALGIGVGAVLLSTDSPRPREATSHGLTVGLSLTGTTLRIDGSF